MAHLDIPAAAERDTEPIDPDLLDNTPVRTYWHLARGRFLRNRLAVVGLVVLTVLVIGALVIPALTGDAWRAAVLSKVNAPPEIGTDENGIMRIAPLGYSDIGQNVLARLAKATGTSLSIGTAAVLIIRRHGHHRGLDRRLRRGLGRQPADAIRGHRAEPAGAVRNPRPGQLLGPWQRARHHHCIGITSSTLAARLVRAEFLRLREVDYVAAARALGASPLRIIFRHMLPPALAPIIVAATLGVADSVVIEAALSFLGFGISQPEASLGNMLTEARTYFLRNPALVAWPGLVLVAIVMSASFLGDGLRDALDPRQR